MVLELGGTHEQSVKLSGGDLFTGEEVAWQAPQCTLALVMQLRVLTWNLMHGRAQPPAGRDLLPDFRRALAGWEWDVALLQEVPPWWPPPLAASLDAEFRLVLTSRNSALGARRAVAVRWPDLIKSNGGGCNAILARSDRIVVHRTVRLRRWPERRWMHAVRLACGIWMANLHAAGDDEDAALGDVRLAVGAAVGWADGEPLAVGGDFNLRQLQLDGLRHLGGRDVDHLFAGHGLVAGGPPAVLDRGSLSDHPPLAATVVWP
jgi:endonuclease/exonuclease/phosphatase family metal-dependent hydrolase